MPLSTNGYGCAGKSPRLGPFLSFFLPSFRLPSLLHRCQKNKTVPPTSSILSLSPPRANCFLCWKKQSRRGEGKKPRYPFLPRKTPKAKRESDKARKASEGGEQNRRQSCGRRGNVHNKSFPFSSTEARIITVIIRTLLLLLLLLLLSPRDPNAAHSKNPSGGEGTQPNAEADRSNENKHIGRRTDGRTRSLHFLLYADRN